MAKKKPAPKKPVKKPKKQAAPAPEQPPEDTRRTQVYSDEAVIRALHLSHGLVYKAAQLLGCKTQTIYNRIKSNVEVKEVIAEERGRFADLAEDKVYNAVNAGCVKSSMWVLERLRRSRYVTRTETRIGGDKKAGPIKTETMGVSIDDLPLEFRVQLLAEIERIKKSKAESTQNKESADGIQAGDGRGETSTASEPQS